MRRAALAAAAVAALLAGCGGGDDADLVVSAASSLSVAFRDCAGPGVRLQFAGSDELAAQIRRGVRPDVYAAANTQLPQQLMREGLLEFTLVFATNELVLATPERSDIRGLDDLAEEGTRIAVGSAAVPVGAYTRELLERLPQAQGDAIRANVRSQEPDVKGIIGKLARGAADAGFVYRTDVRAADGVTAIRLPRHLRPDVAYGAGVVTGSDRREAATRFVERLRGGECGRALREAGFGLAGR